MAIFIFLYSNPARESSRDVEHVFCYIFVKTRAFRLLLCVFRVCNVHNMAIIQLFLNVLIHTFLFCSVDINSEFVKCL